MDRCFDRLIQPLFAAQIDSLLTESKDNEVRIKALLEELKDHPSWGDDLVRQVNSKREEGDPLGLESAIRKLGIESVRGFVIVQKLSEVFFTKAFERDKETGIVKTPSESLLVRAAAARECFGTEGRYRDSAYLGGLIFDLLSIVNATTAEAALRKRQQDFINECFKEGLSQAGLALKLARGHSRLVLEKQLIPLVLFHQASYAVMALFVPGYLEAWKGWRKKGLPVSVQNLTEVREFKGTHSVFASLLVAPFSDLETMSEALLHIQTPQGLYGAGAHDFFDIAAIACLAQHFWINKEEFKEGQTVKAHEIRPELKGMNLTIDTAQLYTEEGD